MIVTGVGSSKSLTEEGSNRITEVATLMNKLGWTLRSGGANGADTAFENCFTKKEIYLPWKGFNGNSSSFYNVSNEAFSIAKDVHPFYFKLSVGAKKLHARNCYQVLGYYLDKPSDILVCWTKDKCVSEETSSISTGGTRTAIVLADRNNVPVYNLNIDEHYIQLKKWLEGLIDGNN